MAGVLDNDALMAGRGRGIVNLTEYHPTWRDRIARRLLGDAPSQPRRDLVGGLLGSTGLGQSGVGLVDFTPAGVPMAVQEAYRAGNPQGMALAVMPMGGAARASAGALKALPMVADGPKDLASRSVRIYDPPVKPPHPFEADYPAGAPADAAGRLAHDIEGRPLTARYVVGRRVVGGEDQAFPSAEFDALAKALTGRDPEVVSPSAMGQKFGDTLVNRYTGLPIAIRFDRSLPADGAAKVLAHELGHAVDQVAGNVSTTRLSDELKAVYNTLNNPNRAGSEAASWGKPFRPQDLGYKGEEIGREHIVEAFRAYMADPNYLKTVAPRTAAAVRAAVNSNPRLREIIQFNSVAGLAAVPLAGALMDGEPQRRTDE